MVDTREEEGSFGLSQQKALSIVPGISAIISFFSALYILLLSFPSRDSAFHRIILCMASHLALLSSWQIYGALAVPVGTPDVWGAKGTAKTCTAQGFFFQLGYSVSFYYVLLSLYSFFAILSNFSIPTYSWTEKWIHIGANLFPFVSAIYLLTVDAFNYAGISSCWVASVPYGCGGSGGVACTRGPQEIELLSWVFRVVPSFFVMAFPTIIVLCLCTKIRNRESQIQIEAAHIAKQALLYLVAIYCPFIMSLTNTILNLVSGKTVFATSLLASVNENMLGLWILIPYLRFHTTIRDYVQENNSPSVADASKSASVADASKSSLAQASPSPSHDEENVHEEDGDGEYQIDFIYDGTSNVSQRWAEFIHDADSDDAMEEQKESDYWEHIQSSSSNGAP